MSAFGDGDRYDPYAGSPRDAYDRGYDNQGHENQGYDNQGYETQDFGNQSFGKHGFGGEFTGAYEEHMPRRRRGSRMVVAAMIGTLALVVVGAIAFAGSLLMSKTSPPVSRSNVAGAAPSVSAPDLFGSPSGDPSGSSPADATTSAAPATTGATTTKPAAPKTTVPAGGGSSSAEMRVITLVNQQRAAAGCGPVKYNAKLRAAAYKHSADMAKRDYFSHDTPEGVSFSTRITNEGYRWSGAAENIAAGQATPEAVMDAWMHSAGHKANILNCKFVDLGVGLEYQVKNNHKTPYWTQDFGTPMR